MKNYLYVLIIAICLLAPLFISAKKKGDSNKTGKIEFVGGGDLKHYTVKI